MPNGRRSRRSRTKFWDEIAAESQIKAKVVEIIKNYNDTMVKAGQPYRSDQRR